MQEWRPLAERGNAIAQFNLGMLYDKGDGVPQDYVQARQWYNKAANQGYAAAQVNLGILYLLGRGGPEDYQFALYWLRLAAKQENAEALTQLGLMYERGNGVPRDLVQARKWYILGAARGDKLGADLRDALTQRMTPAQVFQSQQRAREWKPKSK
jgi:TPR repeat protein